MSERKVDLSGLPRKIYRGREVIDWINSVGYKCKFVYDDIEGEVEIIGYEKEVLSFKYKNRIDKMKFNNFKKCRFGKILFKRTNEFKIEIGSIFKDDKRDIIITNREYRKKDKTGWNIKYYKYKCNKCGYEDGWMTEGCLLTIKEGCSCCRGLTVVPGINDIATTSPEIVDYFVNKNDANNHTKSSHYKILAKCKHCGEFKLIRISDLCNQGFSCNKCGDGISYPNKLMYNLLILLNIEFTTEYSPKWIYPKRYDFYIPSLKLIIEMDGKWHYEDNLISGITKHESNLIDKHKDNMAKEHKIKLIRIDCGYKDVKLKFEYIKNNILLSELNELLNIDYDILEHANVNSQNSMVKLVCDMKSNNQFLSTKDLAKNFHVSTHTIVNYLNIGQKLGMCEYNPNEFRASTRKKVEVFKNNISMGVFESTHKLSIMSYDIFGVKFTSGNISLVCNGKRSHHKGFTFKYV